ncbi:type VII secretion protein EssC [Alkalihalophilus marmarensis]|uniref:type VII secretion protein EssC n=1 Tax=Alkalihalophilus marmarensis TaxID=521377 RepID=UPI00203ABF9D|nr:type VII secretion protein EssC [Alkalihalophilus marmarensis]MCM3491296.1 type VII secretion protein EssC [Alkalihalophilus marmarensis]
MQQLFVFYKDTYQLYPLEHHKRVTIGNSEEHSLTLYSHPFTSGELSIVKEDGYVLYQEGERLTELKIEDPFTLTEEGHSLTFILKEGSNAEATYYVGHQKEITVGHKEGATIVLLNELGENHVSKNSILMDRIEETWHLSAASDAIVYVNGKQIKESKHLFNGDVIYYSGLSMTFIEGDLLHLSGSDDYETSLARAMPPTSEMKKKYPDYRRTPRMIYDLPEEKVTFSFPSQEGDDNQRALWLLILPPLMMLIVMGMVALLIPRGVFIIISIVMFTTTIFTSTIQYFREKKKRKIKLATRLRVYNRYLEQKREELQALSDQQKKVLYYHFPSFEKLKTDVRQISDRIFERTLESEDFLHFRVGRATVPASYEVAVGSLDFANREIDDLVEKSQEMIDVYNKVENVPLTIDASKGAIGLIGKQSIVQKEIQQIVGQLAFFHSYHDIRFVAIFDEEEYGDWEWMKWLPHFQLPHSFARGFVYNERTRDQLLSSIYEILRERDMDEEKDKKRFYPHIVFIVSNRALISEHLIMEYLEGEDKGIGMSTIFATDTKENLAETIHTLVGYINDQQGEILIQEKKALHTAFDLDSHQQQGNETFARTLRSLNHLKGMNNSIPEMVSFLDLFNAKDVEELDIPNRWLTNQSSKSLAVPIGLKGKKDVAVLNLHEKAHGPHGLLAGTTGSGKSELLQTYILSLAVHYHPHEVAFLLIDYKGGGMAQPFKQIPHLLGTITNINESQNFSTRALASINSEMKRRQRLFDQFEVNHINDYTDLYKEGTAKEPLPHLFLISDEFAELKNEEPEFIRELVSAARIGRSLGVHLILATQKPGGVIDNQIWSNARFKIALKVQDATDSKEVLKNSDAANLTITGRGYLQVGNNEVYELFQSAWSGAPYLEETVGTEDEISLVTDLGLVQLSNVSAKVKREQRKKQTEIEAIVSEIANVQSTMGIQKLQSPWLPPLASRLASEEAGSVDEGFLIGLKDEPERQSQTPYRYRWQEDGNIGIFGSAGYGKSTTIMTYLLRFAEAFTPEELHYYVFDFGNSALLPLRQLPHTADYFRFDDQRKIEKFMVYIKKEIEKRKQLFLDREVSNITHYNRLTDEILPTIVLTIDNFDLVKEELPDIETQFIQFARDGQSLGIMVMLSATRINVVRQPLMNSLKTKVVHYLMDSNEKFSIIGRTPYEVEAIAGRALIIKDQVALSQMYLPAWGEDDLEILAAVKDKIERMKERYQGCRLPAPIPMLPTNLDYQTFAKKYAATKKQGSLSIGLDEETVTTLSVDIESEHCLVVGQSKKGKTNAVKVLLEEMFKQEHADVALFDGVDRGLSTYASRDGVLYMETKDQINEWLNSVEETLRRRENEYLQVIGQSSALTFAPIYLVVDSVSRLQQTIDAQIQGKISTFMKKYTHLGFTVIVAGNTNDFTKGFDPLTNELKQIRQAVLLAKKSDQSLITLPFTRNEPEILAGFGYLIQDGTATRMQIPKC